MDANVGQKAGKETGEMEADVVIIGSGIAGALTACSLAKSGIKNIIMLEAGPRVSRGDMVQKFKESPVLDALSGFPDPDWAPRPAAGGVPAYIENTGPESGALEYLRIVGGTTWHWGGCTPRFRPVDFRLSSAHGVGFDWPIDYQSLEPYYSEAELEIGVAGDSNADDGSPRSRPYPLPPVPLSYCDKVVIAGLRNIGIRFLSRPAARATKPYNGRGQCQGFGTCSPICPSGAQYAAIDHVEKAECLGVQVLENTRVDGFVAEGLIKSVRAQRRDGTAVAVRGKIFVLAANAMETPRLLLMSATESLPQGLANSSGQVGRNFMEHPKLTCRLLMPEPVYAGRGPQSTMTSSTFRDGEFRRRHSAWFLAMNSQVQLRDIVTNLLEKGEEPPLLDAEIRNRASKEIEFNASLEQLSHPDNRLTLDWSRRDRAGQPLMRLYSSRGEYERAGFSHARETFLQMAKALAAKVISINDSAPMIHLMGTTRMGTDPKNSVTDSFGRCHDHKNLFIAGSSLFPTGGCVNPTLTIAALALRTADEIARQLKV